jgi:hypothetical protein
VVILPFRRLLGGPKIWRDRLEQNVLCRVNNARLRWRQNGRHMRTRDDNKTSHLKGALTHALALADQVDYEIGRWLFALGQGISLPPCKKEVSAPPRGLTSDIQDAIGQRLREAYPLEQSVPAGLAGLLSRFEQQANPLPEERRLPEGGLAAATDGSGVEYSSDPARTGGRECFHLTYIVSS